MTIDDLTTTAIEQLDLLDQQFYQFTGAVKTGDVTGEVLGDPVGDKLVNWGRALCAARDLVQELQRRANEKIRMLDEFMCPGSHARQLVDLRSEVHLVSAEVEKEIQGALVTLRTLASNCHSVDSAER